MRSLLLEIEPDAEIEGATILADCLGDELIVQSVLDRILKKENPAAPTAGTEPKTDDDL